MLADTSSTNTFYMFVVSLFSLILKTLYLLLLLACVCVYTLAQACMYTHMHITANVEIGEQFHEVSSLPPSSLGIWGSNLGP